MFLVDVQKNQVTVVQKEPITSGSVNAYLVSFSFSEEWEDLTRVAVFKADGDPVNVLLDDSNECFIPWEVMTDKDQPILFGVYGTMGSKVVLPTVWANAGTTLEGVITGLEGQEPQPNLLTQLTGRIKDLEDALKSSSGGGGGSDGVSPTITVTEIDGGHRITITDVNGEQFFDVMDGKNGIDGSDGDDGFSPIVNVTEIDDGHRITIVDANGEQSFDVLNGQNGENGTDGKSAYQIAVEHGFNGTVEEWLESLNGKPGSNATLEAGDGISINGDAISVTTPVQGVYSQEEYDALPEEQRNKGLYVVDDGQSWGGSSGSSMEVYDGKERVIGTWFGKPLYRRVIQGTTPSVTNQWARVFDEPISNLDTLVSFSGSQSAPSSAVSVWLGIPNSNNQIGLDTSNYVICACMAIQFINQPINIILEYTKTTDQGVTA